MSRDQKNIGVSLLLYWKSAICMILMLIIFLLPADNLSKAPSIPFIAEAIHIIMFAILTWILVYDRDRTKIRRKSLGRTGFFAFITGLIFGIIIEILQEFSGLGRNAEIKDVLFDLGGIMAALGILIILFQRKRNNSLKD